MLFLKSSLLTLFFLILVLNLCFVTFNFQYIYLGISYSLVGILFLINLFITFRNRDNLIFTIIFSGIVVSNFLAYLFIKFWVWLDNSESNLSPMIKIAITGGAIAVVSKVGKELGTQIWNWCHQYFVTMCVIKNLQNPNLFQYLLKYFVANRDKLEIQKNKFQELINLLNIKEGNKILEIGCGWGGFAEFLAKKYDVSIDCITISKNQYDFTKKRIFKSGLNNKVNVKFLDYRDLKDKYDHVASIEMIEAVGENYMDKYFQTIKKVLNNNGTAALQGIVIKDELFERYRANEDFIQKYIFPGGFLPSINFMEKLIKKNSLKLEKINSYSDDYARTLSTWRKNFLGVWDKISPLGFDDYFKRMWEFYLSYCEGGFKSRNINLIQFSMSNRYFS